MSYTRDENLLGALALAVTDAMRAGIASATDRGPSVASALITVEFFEGLSIEALRHHLDLSHPATVRLVDRLVDEGLLERRPTGHGRTLALHLTDAGRELAGRIEGSRRQALRDALGTLTPTERRTLTPLVEKLLAGLVADRDDAHRMCRLCDQRRCDVRPRGCPVDRAVPG